MTNTEIYQITQISKQIVMRNNNEDTYVIKAKIINHNNHVGYIVIFWNIKEEVGGILRLKKETVYNLTKQGKILNALIESNQLVGKGINLDELPIGEISSMKNKQLNLI